MKRPSIAFLICFLAASLALAHEHIRDKTTIQLGSAKITIDYGTPKLKGRNLDDLIKPGTAWRMGMDDATTLETAIALNFGGKTLAPGKYSLFARPDEKKNWTLLVSTGSNPRLDPTTVVVEAPLHFMKEKESVEILKMTLVKAGDSASLTVSWGTYRLHTTFKAA